MVLMDVVVFHNFVAAGRDQRTAGSERRREVDQCGPHPRCARRQVISIFFRLHPPPHPFARSLGDQFARWTSTFRMFLSFFVLRAEIHADDVFKSTVHRAVNRSGVARYSMPLFFGTDYNVPLQVSTPSSCCSTRYADNMSPGDT